MMHSHPAPRGGMNSARQSGKSRPLEEENHELWIFAMKSFLKSGYQSLFPLAKVEQFFITLPGKNVVRNAQHLRCDCFAVRVHEPTSALIPLVRCPEEERTVDTCTNLERILFGIAFIGNEDDFIEQALKHLFKGFVETAEKSV